MPTQRNSTNDILFLSCWPVIDMEFCNHTVNRRVKFVIWSLRYGSISHFQIISRKFEFMAIFNDFIKLKYWNSSVLYIIRLTFSGISNENYVFFPYKLIFFKRSYFPISMVSGVTLNKIVLTYSISWINYIGKPLPARKTHDYD